MTRAAVVDPPLEPMDMSACYVCGGLFSEVEKFANLAVKASQGYEFATFLVGTKIDAEVVEREESFWTEVEA